MQDTVSERNSSPINKTPIELKQKDLTGSESLFTNKSCALLHYQTNEIPTRNNKAPIFWKKEHKSTSKLLGEMPDPLSMTWNHSSPYSFRVISMLVAPASKLFSTNSFTADERFRITWPAQILWTAPLFIGFITVGESAGVTAASIEALIGGTLT